MNIHCVSLVIGMKLEKEWQISKRKNTLKEQTFSAKNPIVSKPIINFFKMMTKK